jgi:xanthine dehydrogenase small subunit
MQLEVNGTTVDVTDETVSLLDVLLALRPRLVSMKDGCAPQGQCGCCTVLVDGRPRVSCVTPVRRVDGRAVTTLDGLPPARRRDWADAFTAFGASQCGFCTPGIIVRLAARAEDDGSIDNALAAHLCRCTGWQTIREAAVAVRSPRAVPARDFDAASRRATIEGRSPQRVGPDIALGHGGFAIDTVPDDACFAVPNGHGDWVLGETLPEARAAAAKTQGRRTTIAALAPLDLPPGDWSVTLRTSWVEPGYLEPDAAWCRPGSEPVAALANGGAFGAKRESVVVEVARRLSLSEHRTVCAVLSREDTVRFGPKRPPIAAGVRPDGSGIVRVARTAGIDDAIRAIAPGLVVEMVDVVGPPTSLAIRGAGWVEAAVLVAAATGDDTIVSPDGATARATVSDDGSIDITVRCGDVLDEVVLRSYCIGAAHMALGWVTSERLAVDALGAVQDLTIRSFAILRSADMPPVRVHLGPAAGEPVNGSDAVFAAVALAGWRARGLPPVWPCG